MKLEDAYRILGIDPGAPSAAAADARDELRRVISAGLSADSNDVLARRSEGLLSKVDEAYELVELAYAHAKGARRAHGFELANGRFWFADESVSLKRRRLVHSGVETATGRSVSVVSLNPPTRDQELVRRFRADCEKHELLRSKHTIPLLHFDHSSDGVLYYVMACDLAVTLAPLVADDLELRPREICELLSQVAGSLDEAHSHGIAHPELTPATICLTGPIDNLLKQVAVAFPVTSVKTIDDSHHVHIPEAASGYGMVTASDTFPDLARSNCFSLAVIGWELLFGRKPYQTLREFGGQVRRQLPPIPEGTLPDQIPLARALVELLESVYQRRAEARFALAAFERIASSSW